MGTKINITKEFLETCGDNSLQGLLLGAGATTPGPITLFFPQTSYAWREKNGGPDIYMLPEFAPYCLLKSVISLIEHGYKISLEWAT